MGNCSGRWAYSTTTHAPRAGVGHGAGIVTEIPAPNFHTFLRDKPAAVVSVLRLVRQRLLRADRERLSYLADDVRARVVRKLLEWGAQYGKNGGDGTITITTFTRRDLAQSVAASEKTVDDVLTELTQEGAISTGRRTFVLRDRERLTQRAQPGTYA